MVRVRTRRAQHGDFRSLALFFIFISLCYKATMSSVLLLVFTRFIMITQFIFIFKN